jgi:hypothetical protein
LIISTECFFSQLIVAPLRRRIDFLSVRCTRFNYGSSSDWSTQKWLGDVLFS